jgi:hypothetical protein
LASNGLDLKEPKIMRCRRLLIIGAVVVVAAFSLLAVGCGGGGSPGSRVAQLSTTTKESSPSSNTSATAPQRNGVAQAVGYSQCMRSHGVLSFPDPSSSGGFDKAKVTAASSEVGSSRFQVAQAACKNQVPSTGQPGAPTQAALRQAWSGSRNFAKCMRSHGAPKWPDPTSDPVHHPERPTFDLLPVGIDPNSPQITTEIHACEPLLNGWAPYVNSEAGPGSLGG